MLVFNLSEDRPGNTINFIEQEWNAFDPEHPFEYKFLDESLNELYNAEQRQLWLLGTFAGLCIFISCMGLFGVSAFTIVQRTKEIGMHKVLGASTLQIIFLLVKNTLFLVAVAACLASILSYLFISRWLQEFVYRDEITLTAFLIATAAALCIVFVTVGLQSLRTARSNPIIALRYE